MEEIRERIEDGWYYRFDYSDCRYAIDMPEMMAHFGSDAGEDSPLSATLPPASGKFVSAATLYVKAKRFDDGLMAAVGLAARRGAGRLPGLENWLVDLCRRIAAADVSRGEPASMPFAACRVGGIAAAPPNDLLPWIEFATAEFLADELRSKPLGFYGWNAELTALFRLHRLLQTELSDGSDLRFLASLIAADPESQAGYAAHLDLAARLTNPPHRPDLRDFAAAPVDPHRRRSLFPPSRSHEGSLLERLYGNSPIPPGFDLLREVIDRVRTGRLDLTPARDSGWYDRLTWALEPLLIPERTPEAAFVEFGGGYRRYLEELFKGAFALARETHVMNVAIAKGGGLGPRRLYLSPGWTVEPLAESYRRRALGYRYVRTLLEETFGPEAFATLRRLGPDGQATASLAAETADLEALFLGAYGTACAEIGLVPDAELASAEGFADAIARFRTWARDLAADPDVAGDVRMMVPVFYDRQRKLTKVWAFFGWKTTPAMVAFDRPPRLLSCERREPPEPVPTDRLAILRRKFRPQPAPAVVPAALVEYVSDRPLLAMPVVEEVYVSQVLARQEFRELCDRHRTKRAILAALR